MQPLQQPREGKEGVEGEDNVLPHRRQAQHGRHQGQVRPVKGCPDHGGPGSLSTPPPPRDNSGSGLLPRLDKAHVSTQTARYKLAEALFPLAPTAVPAGRSTGAKNHGRRSSTDTTSPRGAENAEAKRARTTRFVPPPPPLVRV